MYITTNRDRKQNSFRLHCELTSIKTGRIHNRTVAEGWAGAVMQKPLAIQKNGPMDEPTDRHSEV